MSNIEIKIIKKNVLNYCLIVYMEIEIIRKVYKQL